MLLIMQQRQLSSHLGPLLGNVKSFPSNPTEGYLAGLKQVDKQYIHGNSSGQTKKKETGSSLPELLEQKCVC